MANAPFARFPAKMDSMTEIRALVEGACATAGIDREGCLRILLIVEELFTNTVLHGYRGEPNPMWVALALGESIIHHYEDASLAQSLWAPDRNNVLVAQPVGGLGLRLIRSLAKDASYSPSERNVTCIFSVPVRR
jgi:anti-sigma regulatory factor (Ser/Thr protein kinase)